MRLDWLMWFAGINRAYADPWMLPLITRLLENDRMTLGLLRVNPFSDQPPRYVRARVYRYEFTTPEEKRATGNYWKRTLLGEFLPPLSLNDLPVQRVRGRF
jgi:hypothetical protein